MLPQAEKLRVKAAIEKGNIDIAKVWICWPHVGMASS